MESKITERILSRKVVEHLITNKLFYPAHDWTLNVDLGLQTAIDYIDFPKAFDTVSRSKLFVKLHSYGIPGNLLAWLQY